MFPAPKFEFLNEATNIIESFLKTYGSLTSYLEKQGEVIKEQDDVKQIISDYLDELGEDVKAVSRVNFSAKNVAATSVTYDNITTRIRINV